MKRLPIILGVLLPLATAALLYAWLRAPHTPPNVLLITVDTLRADHLGAYGYHRPTSPTIDALARSGIVFDRAFSHSTQSGPSHATILTGLYAPTHGVVRNGVKLGDDHVTLAEILQSAGYETAMFVGHLLVSPRFGFAQGFDHVEVRHVDSHRYHHDPQTAALQSALHGVIFDDVTAWIARERVTPFFIWLQLQHVHESYEPLAPYDRMFTADPAPASEHDLRCAYVLEAHEKRQLTLSDEQLDHVVALYDGEIAYVDAQLERVLDALREAGVDDETLVVLTADHGEMLFDDAERRAFGHSAYSTDPALRVPLIVRDPAAGRAGRRVESLVGLIDIAPTILDRVGVRMPRSFSGASLVPLLDGRESVIREETYAFGLSDAGASVRLSVRSARHRLTCRRGEAGSECELFDLERDPRERDDVSDDPAHADDRARLLASMNRWYDAVLEEQEQLEVEPPTPEVREMLRRAGYLREESPAP